MATLSTRLMLWTTPEEMTYPPPPALLDIDQSAPRAPSARLKLSAPPPVTAESEGSHQPRQPGMSVGRKPLVDSAAVVVLVPSDCPASALATTSAPVAVLVPSA